MGDAGFAFVKGDSLLLQKSFDAELCGEKQTACTTRRFFMGKKRVFNGEKEGAYRGKTGAYDTGFSGFPPRKRRRKQTAITAQITSEITGAYQMALPPTAKASTSRAVD